MFSKMLFNIPAENHKKAEIVRTLKEHMEIKFVSITGLDIGGYDTDEKIPVELFIKEIDNFLTKGVQTDGSSVVLPKIAALNNAKLDIIPDMDVNWYVDYNFSHHDEETKLPVGTLRIPAFLVHNDSYQVGSRVILRDAVKTFKAELMKLLRENPQAFDELEIDSVDDIDDIILTAATELEFWVKTPDDRADREQLSTSQVLKEQYWKRTVGPVRTALEKSLLLLDQYGFEVEMGHKEVGGVKAKLGHSGEYDHIMEQLEVDWKYSTALQAADNELHVKYMIKDVFRANSLDVTFMAKPIDGVAGSGEHTHIGIAAILKDGRKINLFSPKNPREAFLSSIGFGALMGILQNYEVVNPFIASSNDAFNRLKVGFEAPVCIVTSIGHSADTPSRNRTVLVGLVRDATNPLATRFELRSPNPKSNTYLVLASSYMAILDGINACLKSGKTGKELEKELSKKAGEDSFYLEKNREYRSEKDVFDEFTLAERDAIFGFVPQTVYENIKAFDNYPEKMKILKVGEVFDDITIESYKEAILGQWAAELYGRIIPNNMNIVRECRKLHNSETAVDLDNMNWENIDKYRADLGQDTIEVKCLLTRIKIALNNGDYEAASKLQLEMQKKIQELIELYVDYKKNLY
ncbi:MAG: glutamine synthetase [Eubacteriales bacterium]